MNMAALLRTTAVTVSLLSACSRVKAADTPSPNEPIAKPECDPSIAVSLRYSGTSQRLYLESPDGITRGGCITLAEIWEQLEGDPPLYAANHGSGGASRTITGTWLLTESLYVEDGITLQVRGS